MLRRLHILDLDVTIDGPDALVMPIAFAYRRFVPTSDSAPTETLQIGLSARGIEIDGRVRPLVDGLDPRLQLYQAMLTELMQRIDAHFMLHAAALVCPDGAAMLLAAPSGHGKSSQTLEQVRRGAGLLSDDYAPLDAATGMIAPYPRAVGVIPGGTARVPPAFVRAAGPGAPELFGKRLVDVGDALGDASVARLPAPLRRIVLLTSGDGDAPTAATRIELAARHDAGPRLERRLSAIAGVELLEGRSAPPLYWLALKIDPSARSTASLEQLLEGDDVLFFEKFWAGRPDFGRKPTARPIARRIAAEHLGRELLNRRPGGRLLARHGNRLASLFFELAGALRHVRCIEVRVGRFEQTATLIEQVASGAMDGEAVGATPSRGA